MLIRFHDVSKSYGAFDVLRNVSFELHPGTKTGLIGPNGCGKTTLLGLIENPEAADGGIIARASGLRVGRLDQMPDFGARTVLEAALDAFADLRALEARLGEMEAAIADRPDGALLDRYAAAQQEFEFLGGYDYAARTESALFGVGFSRDWFDRPAASLSGGERNRLALARLLLSNADLLLLDEPTNHLDIRSIEWLEHYLRDTEKALLIVSHDRFFLDRVVTRILDLERGRLADYKGNYSAYLIERDRRLELQQKAWQRQQDWIEQTEDFIRRNIAGQKTRQAQSRRNALARVARIEKPISDNRSVRFRFRPVARTARHVLAARELTVGYGSSPVLRKVSVDVERGQRWALAGPNGSGKTTLLRTLVGRLAPLGGELDRDERLEIGYYDQQLEDLDPGRTVLEEVRALDSRSTDGELRSFLAQFLFRGDDVSKGVAGLSGGERSRLALARIIYQAPPLLALDEPTNHLDIPAREALESALEAYPGTMLFVTHDRRLVEKVATHILYVDRGAAAVFDRFDAFERWLGEDVGASAGPGASPAAQPVPAGPGTRLSKNKRERIEREIGKLEAAIAESERELGRMEALFQEPPAAMDWDASHRRYAEVQQQVAALYKQLERQLKEIE